MNGPIQMLLNSPTFHDEILLPHWDSQCTRHARGEVCILCTFAALQLALRLEPVEGEPAFYAPDQPPRGRPEVRSLVDPVFIGCLKAFIPGALYG